MGLSISKSNVLIGVTPTIVEAGVGEVPANISDPDHSLTYTSGSPVNGFEILYGAQTNISYVAISGHTAASNGFCVVYLYDDTTLIDTVQLSRNNNVMFTFPSQSFTNLRIEFWVTSGRPTTISYVAAGEHLVIETGEQSGYKRNWLNRHTTQRTTTNLQVGPVSSLTQKKSLTGSLSLPNEAALFSEDEWQDFIDFSFDQPFFIKEVESKPESSYICFDPQFNASAHSQTTALNMLNLKFTVFNGL